MKVFRVKSHRRGTEKKKKPKKQALGFSELKRGFTFSSTGRYANKLWVNYCQNLLECDQELENETQRKEDKLVTKDKQS